MNHHHLTKIDRHILIWGLIATAVATPIGGISALLSALIGATLAVVNWMAFRYVVLRMAASGNRMGFGISLGIKTVAILGVITLLFFTLPLEPVALICGFSALFLGIVTYVFKQSLDKGDAVLKKDS
jgi:hypothetical protein